MNKLLFIFLFFLLPQKLAYAEFSAQGELDKNYAAWIEAHYILRGDLEHDNRPMAFQTSGNCPCDIFLGSWGTFADGSYGSGSSHTVSFDTHTVRLRERNTWDEKPVTFSEVARALKRDNLLNTSIRGRWEFYPRPPGLGLCFNLGIHYTQKMSVEDTARNPIILCSPLDLGNVSCDIEGPDYINHGTLSNNSINGHSERVDYTVSCTDSTKIKVTAKAGLETDDYIYIADGLESEVTINGQASATLEVEPPISLKFNVTSKLHKSKDIKPGTYSGIFLLGIDIE